MKALLRSKGELIKFNKMQLDGLEGKSVGGGTIDLGVLQHTPLFAAVDNKSSVIARERTLLRVLGGKSSLKAASKRSSHSVSIDYLILIQGVKNISFPLYECSEGIKINLRGIED